MNFIEKLKLHYRARRYASKLDPGEIGYILRSVKEGHTVLDIGAHKGGYLYFFQQKVGNTGMVRAFEPQSALCNYLRQVKKIMRWSNVEVEHLALSANADGATLYIPTNKTDGGTSPGATLVPPEHRTDFNQVEEVATDSLDAYCAKHALKPNFIKMDVEGNELTILHGGKEIIEKARPTLLIEIEARHVGRQQALETIEFLTNMGYKAFFVYGKGLRPFSEFDFDIHQNPNEGIYCNNFVFEA